VGFSSPVLQSAVKYSNKMYCSSFNDETPMHPGSL
jgi:hypothetical protein